MSPRPRLRPNPTPAPTLAASGISQRPVPQRVDPVRSPIGDRLGGTETPGTVSSPSTDGLVGEAYRVLDQFLEEGRKFAAGQSAWTSGISGGHSNAVAQLSELAAALSRVLTELSRAFTTLGPGVASIPAEFFHPQDHPKYRPSSTAYEYADPQRVDQTRPPGPLAPVWTDIQGVLGDLVRTGGLVGGAEPPPRTDPRVATDPRSGADPLRVTGPLRGAEGTESSKLPPENDNNLGVISGFAPISEVGKPHDLFVEQLAKSLGMDRARAKELVEEAARASQVSQRQAKAWETEDFRDFANVAGAGALRMPATLGSLRAVSNLVEAKSVSNIGTGSAGATNPGVASKLKIPVVNVGAGVNVTPSFSAAPSATPPTPSLPMLRNTRTPNG